MRTTLAYRCLPVCMLIAGFATAGMLGCSSDTPTAPPIAIETSIEHAKLVNAEIFVLLEYASDFQSVGQDYGISPVHLAPGSALALYLGTTNLTALGNDPRVRVVQMNENISYSEPVEITLGFHEGDWEDASISYQDALAPLRLELVHRRTRGKGVRIAVLDTGVDPDHPHLASRVEMVGGSSIMPWPVEFADGIDNDGDGKTDEAFGHGTHVAGIIASVAPLAEIIPIKVLDSDGMGTAFTVALGIYEAIDRGADIINLSLVFNNSDAKVIHEALRDAEDAGLVIVGAAGNIPGGAQYPASDSHVFSVGATMDGDLLAWFSASGGVRVGAPGVGVTNAYPGGLLATGSGTSMACAVASGCVALLTAWDPAGGPHMAVERLRNHAVEIIPSDSIKDGRIDPLGAMVDPEPRRLHPHVDVGVE